MSRRLRSSSACVDAGVLQGAAHARRRARRRPGANVRHVARSHGKRKAQAGDLRALFQRSAATRQPETRLLSRRTSEADSRPGRRTWGKGDGPAPAPENHACSRAVHQQELPSPARPSRARQTDRWKGGLPSRSMRPPHGDGEIVNRVGRLSCACRRPPWPCTARRARRAPPATRSRRRSPRKPR